MSDSNDDLLKPFRDGGNAATAEQPSLQLTQEPITRLEIEALDGSVRSVPYAGFVYIHFDGHDCVSLILPELAITLSGHKLGPVYQAIHEQRAKRVIVRDSLRAVLAGPNVSFVDTLKVEAAAVHESVSSVG